MQLYLKRKYAHKNCLCFICFVLLLRKIIEAYASRKGIATNAFRFMFDGQRLQGDVTPKMVFSYSYCFICVLLSEFNAVCAVAAGDGGR